MMLRCSGDDDVGKPRRLTHPTCPIGDRSCNPRNGHIVNDAEASRLWARDYDPIWKPVV